MELLHTQPTYFKFGVQHFNYFYNNSVSTENIYVGEKFGARENRLRTLVHTFKKNKRDEAEMFTIIEEIVCEYLFENNFVDGRLNEGLEFDDLKMICLEEMVKTIYKPTSEFFRIKYSFTGFIKSTARGRMSNEIKSWNVNAKNRNSFSVVELDDNTDIKAEDESLTYTDTHSFLEDAGSVVKPSKTYNKTKDIEVYDKKTKEFVATFSSVKEASEELEIDTSNISKVLNGKRNSTGGFMFSYTAEEKDGYIIYGNDVKKKGLSVKISELVEEYHIPRERVIKQINKYCSENDIDFIAVDKEETAEKDRILVLNEDTNVCFGNWVQMDVVVYKTKCSVEEVEACLAGTMKSCNGYKFRLIKGN
jgi:hypothetical protein